MSETARERVALAIYDANTIPNWQAWERESAGTQNIYRDQADAAIAAYGADLWERALDPATLEAVAKAEYEDLNGEDRPVWEFVSAHYPELRDFHIRQASAGLIALLTALLGPRPESEVE